METQTPPRSVDKVFDEYESLRSWPYFYESINEACSKYEFSTDVAKSAKNKNLNRYRDVNPYDHSRIVLKRGKCDYINANLVPVEKAHRKYILTQGPLPNTVSHFWSMAWEQNSKAIVMLNKIIEKNRIKCHQYWPTSKDNTLHLTDVSLEVSLDSEEEHHNYTIRTFKLTDTISGKDREILQYHYLTWPDFGLPKSPKEFLSFLRAVRKSGSMDENVGAPIVHCSAGIGRSGTFCLVDSCLVLIAENGADSVNVGEVLVDMRKYRMGLVQTVQQLRFSFMSIVEGMKSNVLHNLENSPELEEDEEVSESSSESESEAPPPPPPRTESLPSRKADETKPIPSSPESSPPSSPEEESPPKPSPFVQLTEATESVPVENGLEKDSEETVRQRKSVQADKQKQLADKVQEMKRKQEDAENWEQRKRSLKRFGAFILFGGGALLALYFKR